MIYFNTEVLESVVAGFDAVSKDTTRKNLGVVNLKTDGGKVTVTATNGFSLVSSVFGDHDFKDDFEFNFGKESIPSLKYLIKQAKSLRKTQVDLSRDEIFNRLWFKSFETEFMIQSIDTEFPKVCVSLVEANNTKEHVISFDFEYLKNVIKTLELSQYKSHKGRVKLSFGATDKPIVVEAVNGSYATKAIVMPVKQ